MVQYFITVNVVFDICVINDAKTCFCRLREVGMPADYVNKLARMFQDIKVSEDLNQQFKDTYRNIKGSIAGKLCQHLYSLYKYLFCLACIKLGPINIFQ